MSKAREVVYEVLVETERNAYANIALKNKIVSKKLSKQDAAFATSVLYTTFENLLYIDFLIDGFAKGKIQNVVRCLLRAGVCEIVFMNTPNAAACSEYVKIAKQKQKPFGFVNAILRKIGDAQKNETLPKPEGTVEQVLSVLHSWPLWIVQLWSSELGFETTKKLIEYQKKPSTTIRINTLVSNKQEILQHFSDQNYVFEKDFQQSRFCSDAFVFSKPMSNLSDDEIFKSGKITIHSEGSMLAALSCKVKPGMRVLDACAAPGGKTAFLAAIMQNGEIHAWDKHEHRAVLIEKTCARLCANFVQTKTNDATKYDSTFEQYFDVVLVDAPCSGLGVFSKPDAKFAKKPEDIADIAVTQKSILENCAKYVKPGGALVFSTCTISKAENEDNATAFLENNPDFVGESLEFLFDNNKPKLFHGHSTQLLPCFEEIEGFFIARFVKKIN